MAEEPWVIARAFPGPQCGYCNACKWWADMPDYEDHYCALTQTIYFLEPVAVTKARAEDFSGYGGGARLITEPGFGCVQWEAQ